MEARKKTQQIPSDANTRWHELSGRFLLDKYTDRGNMPLKSHSKAY
jgi:hypothetical protein